MEENAQRRGTSELPLNERRERPSGHQLQGRLQGALLDHCPLTEPGRVHAVLVATRPAFVVDVLGDGIEQASGGAIGGFQLRTAAAAFVQALHPTQRALVR